jgi:hypothetical protein
MAEPLRLRPLSSLSKNESCLCYVHSIRLDFDRYSQFTLHSILIEFVGRIHFFLEISKFFQKVMTFFEKMYPVFKKFFKNVLEKPKPFGEAPRKS